MAWFLSAAGVAGSATTFSDISTRTRRSVWSVGAGAQDDLVVGFDSLDAKQGVLDLRREHVDPAHDHHVVRPAHDLRDAGRWSARTDTAPA